MDRWWDSADAPSRLALVDGSDPGMGVSVAVLGFHAIAKAAMSDLANQTLVDRAAVEAVYDEVDVEPVRKAVKAATTEVMGPVAAARYADLVVADWLLRGRESSSRLTATLVAKGLPWPRAVSRTSAVAGVPLERLGRYATVAATPGLDPLSAADAADRVLMDYAASRGALEYRTVSKASAERSRTHEDVPWDEQSVKRDEGGRFAAEGSSAASQEAKERLANRAARKKRAAKKAKRAVSDKRSELTAAAAPAAEQTNARQATAKPRQAAGKERAAKPIERTALKMDRAAKAKFREQAKAMPRDESKGSGLAPGFLEPRGDAPFGLEYRDVDNLTLEQWQAGKPYRTGPCIAWGEPEAYGGTPLWSMQQMVDYLDVDHRDTASWDVQREWISDEWAATKSPPDPATPFNPADEYYSLIPTVEKLDDLKKMYRLPGGATPAVPLRTGNITVTAGSGVDVGEYFFKVGKTAHESSAWATVRQMGYRQPILYEVRLPMFPVSVTEVSTARVFEKAASASRKRSAEHEQWDESLVERDAQGQFATQDAAAQERKERLANRKRRKTRKARRAQLRERADAASAAAKDKAANHPAGKGRDAAGKERGAAAKPRASRQERRAAVAASRPAAQKVRAQSIPPGLPVYSRKTAPMTGPYALSEPLYAMADTIDPSQPLTLMTEQRALKMARDHFSQPPHKAGEEFLEPRQEPYSPILHRFEAGTVPLSGQLDDDMFSVAWPDELGAPWTFGADLDAEEEIRFVVAAPGPRGKRDWRRGSAQVINLVTDFTVGEVRKRSRERDAENEPWDETKINRDALGQFATSETEAMKKARKARRQRREARRKRAAQRTRVLETQAETSAAKPREAKSRERGAKAMKRAAISSKREALAAHRTATAQARQRTVADPGAETLADLLADPKSSAIGQWLGSAGRMPIPMRLNLQAMPLDLVHELDDGTAVSVVSIIKETPGDEKAKAQALLRTMGSVSKPLAIANSPEVTKHAIYKMTQMLGNKATEWDADLDWLATTKSVPYDADLSSHPSYGVELNSHGKRSGLASDGWFPSQSNAVMMTARNALGRVAAIDSLAVMLVNDDRDVTPVLRDRAQSAWEEYRSKHDPDGVEDVIDLDDAELLHVITTIADEAKLHIEPMDKDAWDEAVAIGLSNSGGAPIRLDDKGFFKITSSGDTLNGWRQPPGKQAKE